MFNTKRLNVVDATEMDIPFIIEIESHKENRDYVWIGTYEEHLAEINDDNHRVWLIQSKENDRTVGYALARLDKKSDVFELRRIAIIEKGLGYGREVMEAMLTYAFEKLGTNRFWLDVYPDNAIGIKLYEGLGMHCDGTLRQNYKSSRGYLDQIIYSMLKNEHQSHMRR